MTRPIVLLAALLVLLVAVAGCGSSEGPSTTARSAERVSTTSACRPAVARGVLPPWARTGFSEPRPRLPHTLGRHGRIAALFFADPLRSPPDPGHGNKILWVARVTPQAPTDLRIRAQRMRGSQAVGEPVTRTVVGGPGPSGVDLPEPGCWRLTLRWAGTRDSVDVRYAAG